MVQKTPLFKDLTERQLAAIADCLVPETFAAGTFIITQGDAVTSSSKFYIIEDGKVDCFRTKEPSKKDGTPGKRKLTRSMGANDVFGEVALLTKVPRQADCVATTDVKVKSNILNNFFRCFSTTLQNYFFLCLSAVPYHASRCI